MGNGNDVRGRGNDNRRKEAEEEDPGVSCSAAEEIFISLTEDISDNLPEICGVANAVQ